MRMENQEVQQAILVVKSAPDYNRTLERIALFDENADPVQTLESVGGADVTLTGMVDGTAEEVAATDTVNEAIAKLQAQLLPVATGDAVLVGGTKTVSDANITATSKIRLFTKTPGGTVGAPFISAKTAGASFIIKSTSATDTSTITYEIEKY
jgi:hypothetical protein